MMHKLYLLGLVLLLSTQSFAQVGDWETITSSSNPTARHECSYVAVGNKFYLVGGRGTKPVQAYDPITNTWVSETNPPMQMHHFQAVTYQNKVYVAGAMTGNCCHETPVPNIYIYDPVTKQWSIGPSIPSNRRRGGAGCVIVGNKLYLVCGIVDGHSSGWVNWMDSYDLQTNTWTQLANAPRERDHFHATVVDGKIYAIGGRRTGFNGNLFAHTIAEVDVYDIASNTWSTLPSSKNIPTQRAACPTAVIGDEILVIGGESAQVAHAQTEAFNVLTQTWRTLAPMDQSRHATSAVTHNNEVYIACGAGTRGGSMELSSQEKFSITGGNPGGCVPNEVVSFTLMHAGTDGEIGELTEGMTINLATIGPFSIRANKCQNSGSIKFIVNGSTVRTESGAPYSINGDSNGSYTAWNPSVGAKTLVGTPYSGSGGSGSAGISKTVNFTVVNQPTGNVDCNGVQNGSAHLNSCGICVGGNTGLGENAGKDCNGVCNGSATLDDCGVCSGGNTGHVANSDKDACGVCFGNGSSCGGCQPLQVTRLMLVHEGTAGEIGELTEGMTINLATMPGFSIRADVCSSAVKSVKFILNGSTFRTESSLPYALNGDNNGSYTAWNPSVGAKTLTVNPYSQGGGGGTLGIALTVNFTVVNQPTGNVDCNGVQNGSAHLNSCGICVGGNIGLGENAGKDCNGVCNGSATLDDCGVCSGGNTGHIANADKDACGVCFGNGSSCGGGCQPLQVTQLMLVHEGNGGDIGLLTEGMTINLATMPKFSVRADVCSSAVKSVKFILNGSTFRTESSLPYALNGDNNGSYTAWNPSVGAKTLTVNPYSQGGGGGTPGIALTVNFNVVNQSNGTVDCNGVTGGSAHLNSCGICVGGNTGLGENTGKDCNGVCNGSATLDDCGVCSGGNTGHVANSDKDACGVCFGNGSSCGGGCQPLQVTQLMLVHEGNGGDIGVLTEGMTINLATMPDFSIRADVCSSTAVKSVKFILNGSTFRTESSAPYALNGDNNGSFYDWDPGTGAKTLTATPYSQGGGGGTAGISLTRNFTVTNSGSAKMEMQGNGDQDKFLHVYPNPFHSQLTVEFSTLADTRARAEIVTKEGKVIGVVFDGETEGGKLYQQTFQSETLANGMYFLRLQTGDGELQMRKVLLMR